MYKRQYQGRYRHEQASEGARTILDDSGAISANVRTVASGKSVSGVGIGESWLTYFPRSSRPRAASFSGEPGGAAFAPLFLGVT